MQGIFNADNRALLLEMIRQSNADIEADIRARIQG